MPCEQQGLEVRELHSHYHSASVIMRMSSIITKVTSHFAASYPFLRSRNTLAQIDGKSTIRRTTASRTDRTHMERRTRRHDHRKTWQHSDTARDEQTDRYSSMSES